MESVKEEVPQETGTNIVPLPLTSSALVEQRKSGKQITLNDQVDSLHIKLWDDEGYRKFFDAVYNSQAEEGSLIADDFEAARILREYAKQNGHRYIAKQNLETLRRTLGTVARRYNVGRKQRREA